MIHSNTAFSREKFKSSWDACIHDVQMGVIDEGPLIDARNNNAVLVKRVNMVTARLTGTTQNYAKGQGKGGRMEGGGMGGAYGGGGSVRWARPCTKYVLDVSAHTM